MSTPADQAPPFRHIAILGLGLLGGSIGLAVGEYLPGATTTGYDLDPATRKRAAERGLVSRVCDSGAEAVVWGRHPRGGGPRRLLRAPSSQCRGPSTCRP